MTEKVYDYFRSHVKVFPSLIKKITVFSAALILVFFDYYVAGSILNTTRQDP